METTCNVVFNEVSPNPEILSAFEGFCVEHADAFFFLFATKLTKNHQLSSLQSELVAALQSQVVQL